MDAVDHSKSVASGFEDASVDPVFELVSLSKNTLDFSVATKPKLVFGVDIVKIGHLDLTLPFNLPELKATFTPTYGRYSQSCPENIALIANRPRRSML